MVPLLHCLIGIGNNLINRFCDVVNEYVENLSAAEMKHARALTNPVVIAQTLKGSIIPRGLRHSTIAISSNKKMNTHLP
jgi:hypothetical protein